MKKYIVIVGLLFCSVAFAEEPAAPVEKVWSLDERIEEVKSTLKDIETKITNGQGQIEKLKQQYLVNQGAIMSFQEVKENQK